jgi:3-deoxy-manno-octulosonate cytidylyltransferase (CMP-KDO synthetase)
MDKDCLIVIPARYGSQRFPGKVLAKLGGKPVLQWCWEAAVKAGLGEVIVATEHEKVLVFARSIGARAVMTSPRCQSGTDRVYEAARGTRAKFVINIQGDEPFMKASVIKNALKKLKDSPRCVIGTACTRITAKADIKNPNCVKVALNAEGRALYFSRCPIPFHHPLSELKGYPYYKHCGLYI